MHVQKDQVGVYRDGQLLVEGAVVESRAPARRKQARENDSVSKDDAPGLNAE
jgi:hypothetical protein